MSKLNWPQRITRVITPVLVYFIINIVVSVAAVAYIALTVPSAGLNYEQLLAAYSEKLQKSQLYFTLVVDLLVLLVLIPILKKDAKTIRMKERDLPAASFVLPTLLGVCASLGLNLLMNVTGLIQYVDPQGQMATQNAAMYEADLFWIILTLVILAPVMEEILFRGIIYKRLRTFLIFPLATLIDAILFGAFHMNVVQFIYAFLMGLVFCILFEKFRSLLASIIAHVTANGFSILISLHPTMDKVLFRNKEQMEIAIGICVLVSVICLGVVFRLTDLAKNKETANA